MATSFQDPTTAAQLMSFDLQNALYGNGGPQAWQAPTWSQISAIMAPYFNPGPVQQQTSLNNTDYQNYLDLLSSAGS